MNQFKTTSLADQIFERLENDIIQGVYPRGEILTELRLAEELGVSRTPIREALRRLEQERLIESAGKGSVVLGITETDLLDIMTIRERVEEMLVINRTVRGGEEISSKSSVLICGNVNPGAQIIAGGSIDIRGTCRGVVHAGAFGDTEAFVIADNLMPVQIRIADLIARSPDNMEKRDKAERAFIKDGQIVIESIER